MWRRCTHSLTVSLIWHIRGRHFHLIRPIMGVLALLCQRETKTRCGCACRYIQTCMSRSPLQNPGLNYRMPPPASPHSSFLLLPHYPPPPPHATYGKPVNIENWIVYAKTIEQKADIYTMRVMINVLVGVDQLLCIASH